MLPLVLSTAILCKAFMYACNTHDIVYNIMIVFEHIFYNSIFFNITLHLLF